MTLGQSSAFFLSLTLLAGCAFGDVNGTGNPRSDHRDTESDPPTSTTGSSDTSQAPAPTTGSAAIDYEALFDAPADPTTTDDLVTGLWAASTYYGEIRLEISPNKVVVALKCGSSPAAGTEVGAVVTESKVRMLASKNVGASGYCGIKVTPVEVLRCSDNVGSNCFEVVGTTLSFWGASLWTNGDSSSPNKYTKLSD